MDKKLLFFDIDGTLLTEDERHYFVDSAKTALMKAKAAGHQIFINTGRTVYNLDPNVLQVPFDGLVCGCGTQIIYQGKSVFHHSIPAAVCRAIRDHIRKMSEKTHVVFEGANAHYFNMRDVDPKVSHIREMCREFDADGVLDMDREDIRFDKYVVFGPEEELESLKDLFPGFQYIERNFTDYGMSYEVVPNGYSKATGIEKIREILGYTKEDCYVFGDSSNDLPMLRAVPNSVVMGNAPDELKRIASFVTRAVDDDGIAYALEQLKLIR